MKDILKDQVAQGQGMIMGIMGVVLGAIMLVAMLPVLNDVIGSIVSSNMSSFSNVASIQLMLGMVGILVVVMFLYTSVQGFLNPQQGGL